MTMSKIENALEKAAILRGTFKEKGPAEAQGPVDAAAPSIIIPMPDEAIEVTHPLLVAANNPHTPIAEEYRKLKTVLVHLTKKAAFQNTLMVTSSLCSEGKSITSLNLAISLAQEHDHTVLLVDADLRKPMLHSYLGIAPKVGLSDCITKGVDVGKAIIRTGIGKLSFLPAGERVENPVEFFSSHQMKELLLEMKKRYADRYIIIDTPPVLPYTESRTMSTLVDAIVLVVKKGMASLHEINEAIGYVKGAELLGIVFNETTAEHRSDRPYIYS